VEAIAVGRVLTLSNTNELLDLVHLGEQFLVLSVDEFDLTLLADQFFLCGPLVEVLTDRCHAWLSSLNDSEALDFLIPGAHFLIKHEYVIFQVRVKSL